MNELLLICLSYCIGSIPTAVWISRAVHGIDIRDYGSGNAGATNTFRVLGSRLGSVVMLVDVLKGFIATSLYILLPIYLVDELQRTNFMIALVAACCLGVFLLVLFLTRFVSLSSILAGICFMVCILFIFNEKEPLYRIFAVMVALMVVITHQKNIGRLIRGTESKIALQKRKNRRSLD
jgi:glycerol-3-phosphate acyltransferase PlsY